MLGCYPFTGKTSLLTPSRSHIWTLKSMGGGNNNEFCGTAHQMSWAEAVTLHHHLLVPISQTGPEPITVVSSVLIPTSRSSRIPLVNDIKDWWEIHENHPPPSAPHPASKAVLFPGPESRLKWVCIICCDKFQKKAEFLGKRRIIFLSLERKENPDLW